MSTIDQEIRIYTPALLIDALLHRSIRRRLTRGLGAIIGLLSIIIFGHFVYDSVLHMSIDTQAVFGSAKYFTGALLLLFGPFIILLQLSFFYSTFYFRGLNAILREDFVDGGGVTFEVASVCQSDYGDMTRGFLLSSYGTALMLRLGIPGTAVRTFLSTPRSLLSANILTVPPQSFFTLEALSAFLTEQDPAFKKFLFEQGVTDALFSGANAWVSRTRIMHKNERRWWSRDNLGKISGIGREFSYGIAFELERYIRNINTSTSLSLSLKNVSYVSDVIEKIEGILARSKSANVIMAGEPGVGKMEILIELGRRMREGESVESLTSKHLVLFDTQAFVASHSSKEAFEDAFLKLMGETERAGNIIVVIENFTAFLESVASLNVDAGELLGRFLTSQDIQIIATADTRSFHQSLENNQELLKYFEPVLIETPDMSNTIHVLEEAVVALEEKHQVFFTYAALVRIGASADQYIIDGVMPDKALSLLALIAARAAQERTTTVREDFVDTCVTEKTGIPSGPIRSKERDLLVHLEEVLHERVVGQEDALHVIASAMRRARAGIQSGEKPIGSFLFLGSTGVGKTETAKALAHTFFGNEEAMVRFDMSEFSDESGLERLIGTSDRAGVLASSLREHPYCVLLLDELEKASTSVHDLFLQVLDEGAFTDARGTSVNVRNVIVIATSNAGSDVIWKFAKEGKRPIDAKDTVVDAIIEKHIFKPELINRFDAVVLFEVLNADQQKEIARLMLTDLATRIKERGFTLIVDDTLLNVLMREGYDPEFGARPMRRAIQDIIEEKIALKIIAGGLRPGDSIHFTEEDFV